MASSYATETLMHRPGCYLCAFAAKRHYMLHDGGSSTGSHNSHAQGRILRCRPPRRYISHWTRIQQALTETAWPSSITVSHTRHTRNPEPAKPDRSTSSTAAAAHQCLFRRACAAKKGATHWLTPCRLSSLQGRSSATGRSGCRQGSHFTLKDLDKP